MWDILWGFIKESVAVIKVVGSLIAIVVGVLFGLQQKKEIKARKNGLAGNPERCATQIARIDKVEAKCAGYESDISHLTVTTERIDRNVEKLVDLHMRN